MKEWLAKGFLLHFSIQLCRCALGNPFRIRTHDSWRASLWSHHSVIVSKGVLFCLYPIFFSHKMVFYKLWFEDQFQINKIYRGPPLSVGLSPC